MYRKWTGTVPYCSTTGCDRTCGRFHHRPADPTAKREQQHDGESPSPSSMPASDDKRLSIRRAATHLPALSVQPPTAESSSMTNKNSTGTPTSRRTIPHGLSMSAPPPEIVVSPHSASVLEAIFERARRKISAGYVEPALPARLVPPDEWVTQRRLRRLETQKSEESGPAALSPQQLIAELGKARPPPVSPLSDHPSLRSMSISSRGAPDDGWHSDDSDDRMPPSALSLVSQPPDQSSDDDDDASATDVVRSVSAILIPLDPDSNPTERERDPLRTVIDDHESIAEMDDDLEALLRRGALSRQSEQQQQHQ